MNIAELTKALQPFVDQAESELEEIFRAPVKEYLDAALLNPNWFAAIMHAAGSEADEALRLSRDTEGVDVDELAEEVTKKLAGGLVSTTLVPALLPTPLLGATNQAILSCLRDRREEGK